MHPSLYLPLHPSFQPFFHSSVRLSNPPLFRPSVRPSFQPALYSSFQPFFPSPSLYFSIHSFDFPLFRPTVCRPVLPTLLPCSRWLPSCSWPSLPSAVRRSVLLYGWFIIRLVGFTYLRYKERKYDSALHGHDLTEPIQCVLRQRRVILKHVHRAPLEEVLNALFPIGNNSYFLRIQLGLYKMVSETIVSDYKLLKDNFWQQ